MIRLYSTNCPSCKMLKRQLQNKNIEFQLIEDIKVMEEKGFTSVPKLELDSGEILDTTEAFHWIQNQ